jgi:hypothetical protein
MELQEMQFGAVTFVLAEAILRKMGTEVTHHSIPRNFRDHTGGSDAQADAIPVNDCSLRKWKRNNGQAVDQNMMGLFKQRSNCEAHGPMACAQNIDPVNLDRIDDAHGPCNLRIAGKIDIYLLAQFRRKLFGIV